MTNRMHLFLGISALAVVLPMLGAQAGKFQEGHWRLELNGAGGLDAGSADRSGEVQLSGFVEYEFPATQRATLSLRLLPMLLYFQDDDRDHDFPKIDFDDDKFLGIDLDGDDDDDDTVFGGGVGIALRVYQHKNEYRGLFGQLETAVFAHNNHFEGNDSNVNFLSGIGLGYLFKNDFSLLVKATHISNAGLGDDNSGVNAVGLSLGYNF